MAPQMEPIKTPLSQRVVDFKHRTLPVLIWSTCALLVAVLLVGRAGRVDYVGLAYAPVYEISADTTGVLDQVTVGLFDEVSGGQIVALLDDDRVQAEIETARATVTQLIAELGAAEHRVQSDVGVGIANWTAELRRFQIDEESRRLDALELKVQIESDQIERQRLALELARRQSLLRDGLVSQEEVDNTRLQHNLHEERIVDNQRLLAETIDEQRAAGERRQDYEEGMPELPAEASMLLPMQEAITVESRRVEQIEVQRRALVLRSPVSGQVSQLYCHGGQAVVPGEPILTVSERSVQEIIAYLHEGSEMEVAVNSPVLVSHGRGGGAIAESVVLRVAPGVEPLPARLWRDPRMPESGRAVAVAATPAMGLIPGQAVRVKFLPDN
ncbi:MAG: hypothetical protein GY716_19715 [bacterium]|nr:hypothetical protein [bacterium]